ncbi:MAG: hypothetical protein DYG89_46075 [Caldilinea sp. CFX5]|nr:hypothetical protein [Caldilinea sp. CFX5]
MQQPARPRLLLLIFLLIGTLLAACGSRAPTPQAASAQVAAQPTTSNTTVSVTAKEFSYLLDRTDATAGAITFVVQNSGAMPHDFALQVNGVEQKTPLLEPGQSATLTATLAPGTYSYRCTVLGHDLLGMKGSFTVN